jgi:hypothetical protein
MRRKPSFDRRICEHTIQFLISMRMSFFLRVFLTGVSTCCVSCVQPLLQLRACSINIRMQTSASCDFQHTAWARTAFAYALVDSVGRNATAADVGRATPFQLMLIVLDRRALSAWSSPGQAERRSRRICRVLTTAANACRPKYVERSIFGP